MWYIYIHTWLGVSNIAPFSTMFGMIGWRLDDIAAAWQLHPTTKSVDSYPSASSWICHRLGYIAVILCIDVYMHICTHVSMYVYMCMYIYIYTHRQVYIYLYLCTNIIYTYLKSVYIYIYIDIKLTYMHCFSDNVCIYIHLKIEIKNVFYVFPLST